MSTLSIVLLVILAILVIVVVVLYFLGKKAQAKQAEQQEQMNAMKQTVSMLIIDKKRLIKDSGLPQSVIDQTPKLMRSSKLPIVKAKIGPQIMSLVCDEKIFDTIPLKKEVKASISGIYIIEVKGIRGNKTSNEPQKKQGVFARALAIAKEKAGVTSVK